MKKQTTELVFVLDKSGSMGGLESDTIGGFNSMLTKQKALADKCRITTVLFNHEVHLLHDRIDIQAVSLLGENQYQTGGSTALLDAIGFTIQKISTVQKNTAKSYRPNKVLCVIITDGYENASREFTYAKVKSLIEKQQGRYGWEFIFLGANIDAVATARNVGIHYRRAANYMADSQGTELNFLAVNDFASAYRQSASISDSILDTIREDHQHRGGGK